MHLPNLEFKLGLKICSELIKKNFKTGLKTTLKTGQKIIWIELKVLKPGSKLL